MDDFVCATEEAERERPTYGVAGRDDGDVVAAAAARHARRGEDGGSGVARGCGRGAPASSDPDARA